MHKRIEPSTPVPNYVPTSLFAHSALLQFQNVFTALSNRSYQRSTTSQKYISLNETGILITDLLFLTLHAYINETTNQLSMYMGNYLTI